MLKGINALGSAPSLGDRVAYVIVKGIKGMVDNFAV